MALFEAMMGYIKVSMLEAKNRLTQLEGQY